MRKSEVSAQGVLVAFKQFAKIEVNGKNEDALYTWLKKQKDGALSSKIKWNFTKFLINQKGEVVGRFAPTKTPAALDKEVGKLLCE
ncbi:MAG: hypothetical protein LBK41_01705 [Clostridiales bacterium]|jgi:glutathione peroxidase|nr:hypothetical protein [Clostridiales bacterium]